MGEDRSRLHNYIAMGEDRSRLHNYIAMGERFAARTFIRDVSPKEHTVSYVLSDDSGIGMDHEFKVSVSIDGTLQLSAGLVCVIDHGHEEKGPYSFGPPTVGVRWIFAQWTYSTESAEGAWMFAYGELPTQDKTKRVFPIAKITTTSEDDAVTVGVIYSRISAIEVMDIRDCPT